MTFRATIAGTSGKIGFKSFLLREVERMSAQRGQSKKEPRNGKGNGADYRSIFENAIKGFKF
jgi:hypothetical protein